MLYCINKRLEARCHSFLSAFSVFSYVLQTRIDVIQWYWLCDVGWRRYTILLPNNLARQLYRYTSVPIEAVKDVSTYSTYYWIAALCQQIWPSPFVQAYGEPGQFPAHGALRQHAQVPSDHAQRLVVVAAVVQLRGHVISWGKNPRKKWT